MNYTTWLIGDYDSRSRETVSNPNRYFMRGDRAMFNGSAGEKRTELGKSIVFYDILWFMVEIS